MNETTAGGSEALLARMMALEEKTSRLEAENARMKLVEGENARLEAANARLEADVKSLRREVNLRKGAAKVQLQVKCEALHEARQDAKEALGDHAQTLKELKSTEADSALLREAKNRSDGLVKVKQEMIVHVKKERDDAKEAVEELRLRLRDLAEAALRENEQVRREARRQLANASTERCMMSSNCLGNLGTQRTVLTGCGHVVCYECIKRDVAFTGDDKYTSEPFKYVFGDLCACKVQGCTKKSSEALFLTCPPA